MGRSAGSRPAIYTQEHTLNEYSHMPRVGSCELSELGYIPQHMLILEVSYSAEWSPE